MLDLSALTADTEVNYRYSRDREKNAIFHITKRCQSVCAKKQFDERAPLLSAPLSPGRRLKVMCDLAKCIRETVMPVSAPLATTRF